MPETRGGPTAPKARFLCGNHETDENNVEKCYRREILPKVNPQSCLQSGFRRGFSAHGRIENGARSRVFPRSTRYMIFRS